MNQSNHPIISLCIPTNGISKWVFPVLDSIYSQEVDDSLFEVIVSDNGTNIEFEDKMLIYKEGHENLIYIKSNSELFHNQLDVLKPASGTYLKLCNHRWTFTEGALQRMIDNILENTDEKPVIFYSNGTLNENQYTESSFDSFVNRLGWRISWTLGVGIWKEDYDRIPADVHVDDISPHSCILFSERKKDKYVIYDWAYSKEIESCCKDKGKYDIFKAFAVEEPTIAMNLYLDGDITLETFKTVKSGYRKLLQDFYFYFVIMKDPCSYDLSGFDNAMGIYFSGWDIIPGAFTRLPGRIYRKLKRIVKCWILTSLHILVQS